MEPRRVADTQTLRALAHPVRLALLETLALHGPQTATQAGEHIGESPTTCSWHLRQLARYGFVEEAGTGKGRARPWQLTALSLNIAGGGDTDSQLAATALTDLVRERAVQRYRRWLENRSHYPRPWQQAATEDQLLLWVTPEELERVEAEILAVQARFADRLTDPDARPHGALPVEVLVLGYPVAPPGPEEQT